MMLVVLLFIIGSVEAGRKEWKNEEKPEEEGKFSQVLRWFLAKRTYFPPKLSFNSFKATLFSLTEEFRKLNGNLLSKDFHFIHFGHTFHGPVYCVFIHPSILPFIPHEGFWLGTFFSDFSRVIEMFDLAYVLHGTCGMASICFPRSPSIITSNLNSVRLNLYKKCWFKWVYKSKKSS